MKKMNSKCELMVRYSYMTFTSGNIKEKQRFKDKLCDRFALFSQLIPLGSGPPPSFVCVSTRG